MLTFRYPPEYYFNPHDFEGLLYRPEEKERRARALGIDRVEALDFPTLKDMTPSEFVDRILGPLDPSWVCLLYTSDAADDLLCVDLGGRRFIKKKIKNQKNYRP